MQYLDYNYTMCVNEGKFHGGKTLQINVFILMFLRNYHTELVMVLYYHT